MDGTHADAIRASETTYAGGGGLPALVDSQVVAPGALPDLDRVAAPAPVRVLQ